MTRATTAFYTPLKHPFEVEPSGDREIGRMLLDALRAVGFDPHLASRFLTWRRAFDPAEAARLERTAALLVQRLIRLDRRRAAPRRLSLWLTYQSYYRAPDLLGPPTATALRLPYVLVDTALSAKSRRGPFRPWASAARLAVRRANLIFLLSPRDLPGIQACRGPRFAAERVRLLPPAVDLDRFAADPGTRATHRASLARHFPPGVEGPLILAVAAMRQAAKPDAYRLLAQALERLLAEGAALPWRLAIVGDGPARPEVEAAMACLPRERVAFVGALEPEALPAAYLAADLFAFPGRFHVVYLQAAAAGLPVVACTGSAPDVFVARGGACLTEPTPTAFAAALARLLTDAGLRAEMGGAAQRFVAAERSLATFQARLAEGLALLGLP